MYLKKSWILTKDGSSTLRIDSLNESYHSLHGAVTESEFVYLDNGLRFWQKSHSAPKASVLEIMLKLVVKLVFQDILILETMLK